ncbi:MAG: thioredoxin [Bacteroidales bacterium]|nr:thioredoxin [Bacteroidales bacterium]
MKTFKFLITTSLVFLLSCNLFASDPKGETKEGKGKVVSLTTQEFKSVVYNYEKNKDKWVYEGKMPAIIDFYADWCGPCKRLAPTMDELAKEYDGQIIIYKVDIDVQKELAATFGINSIPTLLFIPMKGKPQLTQGLMPKSELKKSIDSFLLEKK